MTHFFYPILTHLSAEYFFFNFGFFSKPRCKRGGVMGGLFSPMVFLSLFQLYFNAPLNIMASLSTQRRIPWSIFLSRPLSSSQSHRIMTFWKAMLPSNLLH